MSFWSDLWEGDLFGIDMSDTIETLGAEIPIVGPLFGKSQAQKATEEANKLSLEESQRNRDWQERMSNTAYQRSRTDMEAAGLNPILMASRGPTQFGAGSMASIDNAAMPMVTHSNSARAQLLEARSLMESIRTQRTQQQVNTAQAANIKMDALTKGVELGKKQGEAQVASTEAAIRNQRSDWLKRIGVDFKDTMDTILSPIKGIFKFSP